MSAIGPLGPPEYEEAVVPPPVGRPRPGADRSRFKPFLERKTGSAQEFAQTPISLGLDVQTAPEGFRCIARMDSLPPLFTGFGSASSAREGDSSIESGGDRFPVSREDRMSAVSDCPSLSDRWLRRAARFHGRVRSRFDNTRKPHSINGLPAFLRLPMA